MSDVETYVTLHLEQLELSRAHTPCADLQQILAL